jgi:hypothetical protein
MNNKLPATYMVGSAVGTGAPLLANVIADGRTVMATQKIQETRGEIPPGLMSDAAWLLDSAADRFRGEGNLIVPWVPLYEWGPDSRPEAEQLGEFIDRAEQAGWHTTVAALKHKSGWVTFTKLNKPVVHVGILSMIDADKCPLFKPDDTPEQIAAALVAYRNITGVAYRSSPGVSGIAMIRRLYDLPVINRGVRVARAQPSWIWRPSKELDGIHGAGDLVWQRKITKHIETTYPYVHGFDIRAAYLAAWSTAEVGWDRPRHTGATQFDPELHGLWRIWVRNLTNGPGTRAVYRPDVLKRPPLWNPARVDSSGQTWVTTPIIKLMHENRLFPEVTDSYTCSKGARILRPVAERIRDGMTLGPSVTIPGLQPTLKNTYTGGTGMMGTGAGRLTRLDWMCTYQDQTRANILRKIITAGLEDDIWPVEVRTDAVYYADVEANPRPLGELLGATGPGEPPRIGRFRHFGTWNIAEYLDNRLGRVTRR